MPNEIHYGFTRTINLGDFESCKFDIGETRTVGEGEDVEEVYKKIRKDVNDRMKDIVSKIKMGN